RYSAPRGAPAGVRAPAAVPYDLPLSRTRGGRIRGRFPEQLHKPITDHNDFINVMDDGLMNKVVDCINRGEDCR
ncbi:hypothetical protein ACFUAE_24430, partial [Streptomyces ardesiacus]